MSMDKIANLQLETTSQYQSLSQLNVQFWNQDRETAILQFQITRNNYPLALSEENVKVFIALESGDSFLVDDKLEFVDQLNGVVSYTIPADFMRVAKEVKGQVYVTTLDEEEVVVQRQFTFNVANDLIADLPAEDKIREIKYFSDMRAEVAQMMTKLNSDFENMNDYVTQVQDTTQSGIAALTKLIDDKEKAYNANHEAKMKELDDKGDEYSTKFDEDKQYMDEKFTAFQSSVNGSGLVTTGASKDWQKYKLTNDDGIRTYLTKGSVKDIKALNVGFYETVVAGTTDASEFPKISYGSFVELDVMKSDAGRMQVKLVISGTGRTFNRYIHTDASNDTGWLEMPQFSDISTMETTTGSQAKATTAENNAKVYTNKVVTQTNEVIFSGSAKGVGAVMTLKKPYTDYDEIKIFAYGHGASECYVRDTDPNRRIVMYSFNLTDSDASNGDIVETQVERTNSTSFKIASVGAYNLPTATGTVNSNLGLEIYKIVGVRYYANLNQQ
ncbi:BppU family phage baseplate upper protein [Staphylococcus saprophyticus]|uniref:BppU family phage baseplate upper protein n=1 Tax=Staphylococcus saprophyticus TaxID=29385 RepID=UPI0034DCF427